MSCKCIKTIQDHTRDGIWLEGKRKKKYKMKSGLKWKVSGAIKVMDILSQDSSEWFPLIHSLCWECLNKHTFLNKWKNYWSVFLTKRGFTHALSLHSPYPLDDKVFSYMFWSTETLFNLMGFFLDRLVYPSSRCHETYKQNKSPKN